MLNKVLFGLHCFFVFGIWFSCLLFCPLLILDPNLAFCFLCSNVLLLMLEIVVGSILCYRGIGPTDFEVLSCPNS